MKAIFTFLIISVTGQFVAQYSTPGTGVVWNMDSLVQNSSAVQLISANNYKIIEDITISSGDSVYSISNNISFNSGILITVSSGGLYIKGTSNYGTLASYTQGQSYQGFRLEGTSNVILDSLTINNCGGIKVLTPNFKIINCTLENNPTGLNTSGFLEISTGKPQISINTFRNNEVSAISSAANSTVAPIIKGNLFEGNVTSNTNRPQINLSPSGANDTTIIKGNMVIGNSSNEMAGGIAFSSLAGGIGNVVIKNNLISNNRYGITILGNHLTALIDSNTITDNNIQNAPFLGGSGINLNGDSTSLAIITKNSISGNLWGVTVQQMFKVNMGDSHIGGSNLGLNTFRENMNSGDTYALFNNTPNSINATNNCWDLTKAPTLQNAEDVISHLVDDNTLGEVFFDPILMCSPVNIKNNNIKSITVYPNPVQNKLYINIPESKSSYFVELTTINGQIIPIRVVSNSLELTIDVSNLKTGIYILKVEGENYTFNKKILKY